MKPCKFCGGDGQQDLLVAFCKKCGARTINFTGCGSSYQDEERMAVRMWDIGNYEGGRAILIRELQELRGALGTLSRWSKSGAEAAAMAKSVLDGVEKAKATAMYL